MTCEKDVSYDSSIVENGCILGCILVSEGGGQQK
jgi:hypothetical protein